jgi:hypothetical protein
MGSNPTSDTSCHVIVTINKIWIGNRIYWTLKQLVTRNGSMSSLYSLGADRTEDTFSCSCYVVITHNRMQNIKAML